MSRFTSASGYGLSNSSFSLALNTYFTKKRSKAAGIAVTVTGLGPILYPPLITALLSYYGVNGCELILAGLSLHILVAALLLQPIKYHWIYKNTDDELADLNDTKERIFRVAKLKPNGCNESNCWCGFSYHNNSVSFNYFLLQIQRTKRNPYQIQPKKIR